MANACIVSFFMDNINPKTVKLQSQVVDKFNPTRIKHYPILTSLNHGYSMDLFMKMQNDHDVFIFLDIDCVPLSDKALPYMVQKATEGWLVGDAQRSNHIENGQHVFCAPHAMAFSKSFYETIGKPSFLPTHRGDVGEEITWKARDYTTKIEIILPLRYDAPPNRMEWEKDAEPYWKLADGMPVYGIGTTFGNEECGDMFYHNYQIFHPGQQERFWNKCNEILGVENGEQK